MSRLNKIKMEKETKQKEIFYHIELNDGSIVDCNLGVKSKDDLFKAAAAKMKDALVNGIRRLDETNALMNWYSPYMIKKINAPIEVFPEVLKLNLNNSDNESAIGIMEKRLSIEYAEFHDICNWLIKNDDGNNNDMVLQFRENGTKIAARIDLLKNLISEISK